MSFTVADPPHCEVPRSVASSPGYAHHLHADPFGAGYQLANALMAVGRGEWLGVGLGASVQKLSYLPEAHTDFVLAAHGYKPIGRDFPETSIGWYRRVVPVSPADKGKRLWIEFDGVFRNAMVVFNGFILYGAIFYGFIFHGAIFNRLILNGLFVDSVLELGCYETFGFEICYSNGR